MSVAEPTMSPIKDCFDRLMLSLHLRTGETPGTVLVQVPDRVYEMLRSELNDAFKVHYKTEAPPEDEKFLIRINYDSRSKILISKETLCQDIK